MPGISFRDCWIRDDVFRFRCEPPFIFLYEFIDNYVKLLREILCGKETRSILSFSLDASYYAHPWKFWPTEKDIIDLLRCIRRCAKRLNADSHTCVIVNFRIQKQFFLFDLRIAFDQGFVLFTKQSPRRIATQIFAIRVEFHFIEYEYFLILFLHIQIIMILICIQYNSKLIDCTLKWSLMQL